MKNKGYSLIELIVVIAILGILATVSALSLSIIGSSQARQAANKIDATMARCKVGAMTKKGEVYMRLYKNASGAACIDYHEGGLLKETMVLPRKASVTYVMREGASTAAYDIESKPLFIGFVRETGALRPGSYFEAGSKASCIGIEVKSGSTVYRVDIVPLTGKHKVTQQG